MTLYCISQSTRLTTKAAKLSALTAAILIMQSNSALAATDLLSIINNTAQASYSVNGETDVTLKATSNQVRVKSSTLAEYGVTLSKSFTQTVSPGATASWINVLSNTSYNDQTIELSLAAPTT